MEEHFTYLKRSQSDYDIILKLQIVEEIELAELSVTITRQKYVIQ